LTEKAPYKSAANLTADDLIGLSRGKNV
jgi:hypothetical protein